MNVHPAAELFPLMDDEQFKGLLDDIRENGLGSRGVLTEDGQILDGRNRYKACQQLGIPMEWSQLESDSNVDPWKYVISRNLHRRHLTTSQRAMIAARMAKWKLGDNQHTKEGGPIGPSTEEAAESLNVSPRAVKRAKAVLQHGSDELIEAVNSGDVVVSRAAEVAKTTPKAKQLEKAKEKTPPSKPEPKSGEKDDRNLNRLRVAMDAIDDKLLIAHEFFLSCTDESKADVLNAWKKWSMGLPSHPAAKGGSSNSSTTKNDGGPRTGRSYEVVRMKSPPQPPRVVEVVRQVKPTQATRSYEVVRQVRPTQDGNQ